MTCVIPHAVTRPARSRALATTADAGKADVRAHDPRTPALAEEPIAPGGTAILTSGPSDATIASSQPFFMIDLAADI